MALIPHHWIPQCWLCLFTLLSTQSAFAQAPRPDWLAPLATKFEAVSKAQSNPRLSVLIQIRIPEPVTPEDEPMARRETERATDTQRASRQAERARAVVASVMPAARAQIAADGIDVRHVYRYQPFILADISSSDAEKLAANSSILGVYENVYINQQPLNPPPSRLTPNETDTSVNDETKPERAHLAVTVPTTNADKAWALGYRGQGQTIAVLDSGINANHEMFRGKIAAEACFSDGSIYVGYESLCPERRRSAVGPGAATFCPPPNQSTSGSVCMHGSHVAGIAAGDNNSATARLRGVAPDAKIIPIQVFTRSTGCATCLGAFVSDLLAALDWVAGNAATYSIASVNMSLGGRSYAGECAGYGLDRGIQTLRSMGVVVAIASGNDGYAGYISFPACVKDAFSVGSISAVTGRPSYFTNTATQLDLYAPGEDVNAAIHGTSNGYARYSGTSMATPHVAGAVAVLKSKMPNATAAQLEYALRISGPKVSGLWWSWANPRLDVLAALEVLGADPPLAGAAMVGLFPGDTATMRSYVRIINQDYALLNAAITLVQENPRVVLGTHKIKIAEHGAVQLSVRDIENAIRAQALPNSMVTVMLSASRPAYAQHIVMDAGGQIVSNMTMCATEIAPPLVFSHVLASGASDDTSHILMMNTGGAARRASFALYNAATGQYLGVAESPVIDPNSSLRVAAQNLFNNVDHGPYVPRGIPKNVTHVNMFLNTSFTGLASHAVHHAQLGILTDLTTMCRI